MLSAMVIAIALASFVKYKVTLKAQANVRPTGELRIVQAATEGAIMSISVKENQAVKTGDAIATIDDSRLQTKKSQLQNSIQLQQLQLVQINAQIHAQDRQISAETQKSDRSVAAAYAELSGRSRDYRDKQITSNTDVEEAQANVLAAQSGLKAASSKRNRYLGVAKVGALSQDQFEEAQLAVRQQSQAVSAAKAKLHRAIALLNPSDASVAIAQSRIAQEKATGAANKATLNKERDALIGQRIEIQKQLDGDSRELAQVNIELGRTVISATADGIISKLKLRNKSQTVSAGEEIAQIVPSNAPIVIKADVALGDKNKLKEGQNVQMRVSACPYPDYGTLKGKVKAISPDAITPGVNGSNTNATTDASQKAAVASFYQVTIEPENLTLGSGDRTCVIQLGMEGTADIISREETLLQFFLRKARLIADV